MSILSTVVTILLCGAATASHEILMPKTVEASCLSKVLSEITKDDEFLSIVWSERVDNTLKDEIWNLFKEKMKFILNNDDRRVETVKWQLNRNPSTVLYLASTKEDIVDGIPSLRSTNNWGVATKLIIVYLNSSEHSRLMFIDPSVPNAFQLFAQNIQVIYEFGNELTLIRFKYSTCGNAELIGKCQCCVRKILSAKGSECTIRTAVRSNEPYSFYSKDLGFTKGIEIDLVKELSRWSHFNLELVAIDKPVVKGRNFDVIVGAFNQMKDGLVQSIDFQFDGLTWCVKRADFHPPWRNFFLIATWEVWTVAAVGVYVTAATLYAFYYYYHHPENIHYCTGIAALCIFSIPVPYNPTHGIARIHFGILLIYGLLAVISINSFLISIMTKPQHQYQIQTTDELMYRKYTILIDVELVALHHLGDDQVSSYVKQNYELCNGMMLCLRQLSERSNVASIVPRKFAEYFESQSSFPVFCFDSSETFNRVTRSLTMNNSNSLLLNRTNSFIRQAMETGHLLKWETVSTGSKKYEVDRSRPVVLSVEHLLAIIIVYCVCMTVAVAMFIGECLTFKNIEKGGAAGRGWQFLDKYVFSRERIIWRRSLSGYHRHLKVKRKV